MTFLERRFIAFHLFRRKRGNSFEGLEHFTLDVPGRFNNNCLPEVVIVSNGFALSLTLVGKFNSVLFCLILTTVHKYFILIIN